MCFFMHITCNSLFRATDVPVGEDQIHHIELTRYLAKSFNRNFNTIFPRCRALTG